MTATQKHARIIALMDETLLSVDIATVLSAYNAWEADRSAAIRRHNG